MTASVEQTRTFKPAASTYVIAGIISTILGAPSVYAILKCHQFEFTLLVLGATVFFLQFVGYRVILTPDEIIYKTLWHKYTMKLKDVKTVKIKYKVYRTDPFIGLHITSGTQKIIINIKPFSKADIQLLSSILNTHVKTSA